MRRRRQIVEPVKRQDAEPWLALDAALKTRLREALESERLVTEAEVRRFTDEGRACMLMLRAELTRGEEHLRDLDADPASSLVEIAATFRDVSVLRRDLAELETLLSELQEQARAARAAWLTASARSAPRVG
jgi:DNA repair exonuclease SbcCD nuclease subunit